MQFLSRYSCNFKIARVSQVRFSVRFVAAISQGFRKCLKLGATLAGQKMESSCRDKNRLCKRAFKLPKIMLRYNFLACEQAPDRVQCKLVERGLERAGQAESGLVRRWSDEVFARHNHFQKMYYLRLREDVARLL